MEGFFCRGKSVLERYEVQGICDVLRSVKFLYLWFIIHCIFFVFLYSFHRKLHISVKIMQILLPLSEMNVL